LNLNVHFHIVVLDGVLTRALDAGARFHPAPSPARHELEAIARRVRDRSLAWLRRRGYLDERSLDERSNEPPEQTANLVGRLSQPVPLVTREGASCSA
jgi:hypothetical protein